MANRSFQPRYLVSITGPLRTTLGKRAEDRCAKFFPFPPHLQGKGKQLKKSLPPRRPPHLPTKSRVAEGGLEARVSTRPGEDAPPDLGAAHKVPRTRPRARSQRVLAGGGAARAQVPKPVLKVLSGGRGGGGVGFRGPG